MYKDQKNPFLQVIRSLSDGFQWYEHVFHSMVIKIKQCNKTTTGTKSVTLKFLVEGQTNLQLMFTVFNVSYIKWTIIKTMWVIRLEIILRLWWYHNKLYWVACDVTRTVTIFSRMSIFKGALGTRVENEYNVKLFFLSVFNSCSGYTMYFVRFSF